MGHRKFDNSGNSISFFVCYSDQVKGDLFTSAQKQTIKDAPVNKTG